MPLPSSLRIAKSDLFKINPMNLELSEEKYNGRWVPVSTEKVRELATSIATQRQKQPVRVRRISGKGEDAVFTVTAGFTRTKAVILINKDKELRELAGLRSQEDIFPLQCIMSNVNDTEAFVENVIENALRHETSPIDDAHNHEKMRTLGFKDSDIARIVQIAPSRVSLLKQLLLLENKFKLMIHNGEMSIGAGIRLLDIPPEKRNEVIQSENSEGVKSSLITEKVKKAQRENGIKVGRSIKEIRSFLVSSTGDECNYGNETTHIKAILGTLFRWINGEVGEEVLLDAISSTMSGVHSES